MMLWQNKFLSLLVFMLVSSCCSCCYFFGKAFTLTLPERGLLLVITMVPLRLLIIISSPAFQGVCSEAVLSRYNKFTLPVFFASSPLATFSISMNELSGTILFLNRAIFGSCRMRFLSVLIDRKSVV